MPFWSRKRPEDVDLDAATAVERVLRRMRNDCTEARFQVFAAKADLRRLEEQSGRASESAEWSRQLAAHRRQVAGLCEELERLEEKVEDAETYAGSLATRASSARARLSITEVLVELETGDAVDVFERLRSTVQALEREADGMREVKELLERDHA